MLDSSQVGIGGSIKILAALAIDHLICDQVTLIGIGVTKSRQINSSKVRQ